MQVSLSLHKEIHEQKMIKKIGHIILSALMLAATVGITVSKHYCGNMVSLHYFVDESCPMEMDTHCMEMETIPYSCSEDMNCCHTEIESFQYLANYLQEDKLEINSTFSFELFLQVCSYHFNDNSTLNHKILLKDKLLTPSIKPLQSLLQSFLC